MANEIIKLQTQLTENYVADIRSILQKAREYTYRTVNSVMVQAYWLIGERIVRQEQNGQERAEYGKQLIKTLSVELTKDFGTGFSAANLRNMRQFYRSFPDFEICYTLCSELSWSHNRLIMRVVTYSVANGSHQLFVSKYLPYMPTEEEIRREIERKQEMK